MRKEAFKAGSELPPTEPGKLRIYSMRFCPYAERALLVANAKDIPHEIVNVNLTDKPSWYLEKNPEGTVPALELDGQMVSGSLIVADYLDEAYGGSASLTPSDPYKRARDKMVIERFNKVGMQFFGNFSALLDGDNTASEELFKAMQWLEDEMTARGTPFLAGKQVGMVDLMNWPWLERIVAISPVPIPEERLPHLSAWFIRMRKEPLIQKTCLDPGLLRQFYDDYRHKRADYDLGL